MVQICRLCLKAVTEYKSVYYTDEDNGVSTSSLVKSLLPELYLGLSVNPVVCKTCYTRLRDAYDFRLQCLRTENLIGIYVRESKHTRDTIILEDVFSYWKNHYNKNKLGNFQGTLKEWFGATKDSPEKPIILNQTTKITNLSKNVNDIQEVREDDQNNVRTEEYNENTSKQQDIVSSTQTDNTVSELITHKPGRDIPMINLCDDVSDSLLGVSMNDNTEKTQPITDVTSNVQSNVIWTFDRSGTEKCFTKDNANYEKNNESELMEEDKYAIDIDYQAEFDEYIRKACLDPTSVESEPLSKVLPSLTEPDPLAPVPPLHLLSFEKTTPEPHINVDDSSNKIDFNDSSPDKDISLSKRIRLESYNLKDLEMVNLAKELQKEENLKKLGFNLDDIDNEETFILKKIVGKIDKKISYALVPKSAFKVVYTSDESVGKRLEQEMISAKEIDKRDRKSKQFSGLVKVTNMEAFLPIADGKIIEDPLKIDDKVETDQNNCEKLQGNICEDSFKKLPSGKYSIKINEGITKFIDGANDTDRPTDQSGSSKKSPPKPVPLIRVRPVSALKQVRTLNHELFPQNPGCSNIQSRFEASQNLPVLSKVPAQLFENPHVRRPIVLNSQLGSSSVQPILKTYTNKNSEKHSTIPMTSSLKIINPVTFLNILNKNKKVVPADSVKPTQAKDVHVPIWKTLNELLVEKPKEEELRVVNIVKTYENRHNVLNKTCFSSSKQGVAREGSRSGVGDRGGYGGDVIDIKDEPMDYPDYDMVHMVDRESDDMSEKPDDSGEKTRSSSETSFMESINNQDDVLESIVANIPEIGNQYFDDKCQYINCDTEPYMGIKLYRFPVEDSKRLKKWILHCGNTALLGLGKKSLMKLRICIKHFEEKDFRNERYQRINCEAIPKHFSLPRATSGALEVLPKSKTAAKLTLTSSSKP